MNEILQKRIEEAARNFNRKEGIPYALTGHVFNAFIEGANFFLQNQWISVEEALPEQNRNVLALKNDGDVVVAFHDGMDTWWWNDGFICGKKSNGDKKYSSCCEIDSITHWMPIPKLRGEK